MKKISVLLLFILGSVVTIAQKTGSKNSIDLSGRPSDHILMQISSDSWQNSPDSINSKSKGSSRGGNIYFMLDKPFKSNPHFSVAFGLGVGTSHIFFDKLNADINGNTPILKFNALDTSNYFKKYKLSASYVEIPVELRFSLHPSKPNQSFKIALGAKVGSLINAHSKGKTLKDAAGNTINDYTEKISSKSYFNNRRIAATARVGYGIFSVFGAYNISSSIFKDKVAANTKLLQVGLTISGL